MVRSGLITALFLSMVLLMMLLMAGCASTEFALTPPSINYERCQEKLAIGAVLYITDTDDHTWKIKLDSLDHNFLYGTKKRNQSTIPIAYTSIKVLEQRRIDRSTTLIAAFGIILGGVLLLALTQEITGGF